MLVNSLVFNRAKPCSYSFLYTTCKNLLVFLETLNMQHPVSSNRYFTFSYVLLATVFIILDSIIGWKVFTLTFLPGLIRIVLPDIILFFMLLSLWYPVCFFDTKINVIYILVQFLFTGIIFITVWLLFSVFICSSVSVLFSVEYTSYSGYYLMRILVGFLCYLLFIMVFFMIHYHQEIEEKSKHELNLLNMLKQSELDILKSQINPHFLYNSLNSISSLTILSPKKAQNMIANLSDFLRYSLKSKSNSMISFQQEFENIGKYIDIEKIRFEDRLNIAWSIEENSFQKVLPVLILQPLMENAIKYGVYNAIDAVQILFKAYVSYTDLLVEIKNPYDPLYGKKKGEGVGLQNINKRLVNIYGINNLVRINKSDNFFTIIVRFPQMQI